MADDGRKAEALELTAISLAPADGNAAIESRDAREALGSSRRSQSGESLKVIEPVESLRSPEASEAPEPAPRLTPLDKRAFLCLLGQHGSNTWSARAAEFAIPLTLVEIFPDTLLPASIYGFVTTAAAIVFARFMGRAVDRFPKLTVVRGAIVIEKICAATFYAALLADLVTHLQPGQPAAHGILAVVVIAGCGHSLADIAIKVAIERDWAVCMAEGSSERLTFINVNLRRIDLVCKLLSPLVVSLLTLVSYTFAVSFLALFDLAGLVFELFWTNVVYRRIPALERDQQRKEALRQQQREETDVQQSLTRGSRPKQLAASTWQLLKQLRYEWSEFVRLPIFFSSLAISALYLTVLSFDGVMLSYFKSHDWNNAFLAGIRAIMVAAGLMGTLVMPLLERTFGLIRAGSWSIWAEVASLISVIVGFLAVNPPLGDKGPAWASALIFSGMILSRVGLWSFDLVQTKELQLALDQHPDRNSITALQIALQNVADLLKYTLTIILSRPSQFRWAALVSFISVCFGAVFYSIYARQERGHLLHLDRLSLTRLLSRKSN